MLLFILGVFFNPGFGVSGCFAGTGDHRTPVGIYLGHNRVTSSYYKGNGEPVLAADVPADWRWHSQTLERMSQGQGSCEDFQEPYNPITCAHILPGFLASMKAVIRETSKHLNSSFNIGYIVIPNYLRDYMPIMDENMHAAFDFAHYPMPDADVIVYDIMTMTQSVQYGYALVDRGGESFAEDDYSLYLNVEDDFIEVGYGCPVDPECVIQSSRRILLEWKIASGSYLSSVEGIWILHPGKLPSNFSIVELVHDIACLVADFVEDVPPTQGGRHLKAVTIIGGGSYDLLDVAKAALPFAFPDADPAIFLSSIESRYVPSLGAALRSRERFYECNYQESLM
ncbi:hypothetical protein F5Y08DRAFT_277140 [Xylaria arbuscula]|nr:hypothetical protein F5Y08DRAFT_277140 [Xylaria arbuscula]